MVNRQPHTHVAIVVLGNQPIDGSTLTVDCVKRVHHAIELYRDRQQKNEEATSVGCVLVLTGGDGTTTGQRCMTEASMMAQIAMDAGVASEDILLEPEAYSTEENAINVAKILRKARYEPLHEVLARDLARLQAKKHGDVPSKGPPSRGKGGKGGKGGGKGSGKGSGKGRSEPKKVLHEVLLVSNTHHLEWAYGCLFLPEKACCESVESKSGPRSWRLSSLPISKPTMRV